MYDYKDCLELAGAKVHSFKCFGSSQGDWLAKITYNGQDGIVHGYYGSCSGCDEIESTLEYVWDDGSEDSKERITRNTEKATELGRKYLNDFQDIAKLRESFEKQSEWDSDAREMIDFIDSNA